MIKRSQKRKSSFENLVESQEEELNQVSEEYKTVMNTVNPIEPGVLRGPNGKPLVNKDTVNTTDHEKIIGEDKIGNQVVVPKGFKVAEESGTSVKEGMIIEDDAGNQFVWIPVSNINRDGSNKIKVNSQDEEGVEITLGRYTFATSSPGIADIVQKGSEYDKTVSESNKDEVYKIKGSTVYENHYHYELSQSRLTNYKDDTTAINTTALNLKGFIESVSDNHGYYIARYEASFGSGEVNPDASKINTANYITNQKPLSKESTKHTRASNTERLEIGMLWNYINSGDAAKVCRNMYTGSNYGVVSDLVNSYMWDTAIVYIQAMGNTNYANANRATAGNTTLKNTGKETKDEVCHIYDMAGNLLEFTTEYSAFIENNIGYVASFRGGLFSSAGWYCASRGSTTNTNKGSYGFRAGLYVK